MTAPTFRRDRATWQAYLFNAFFSFLLNMLGPVAPFLRDELGLSYTVASLHMSAYALGTVLTGLALGRIIRRAGAYRVVWVGAPGMALAMLLIVAGRHPAVTIGGAFLMGVLGVVIVAVFQGALAEQHGEMRGAALFESSVVGTVAAALAPLAVSVFARTPLTWRAAAISGIAALPLLWLAYRRSPINAGAAAPADGRKPAPAAGGRSLPLLYWLYWSGGLLAVAVEFCILLWGADYLEKVAGLARADAALGTTLFLGAMLASRAANSRLVWYAPARALLRLCVLLTGLGFALFWLGPMLLPQDGRLPAAGGLALAGLAVAGLGIAGLYPLHASLALGAAPRRTVEASAAFTLSSGIALFAMPLLLGRLADWVGIRGAYGLLAVLIPLLAAFFIASGRLERRAAVTLVAGNPAALAPLEGQEGSL